MKDLVIGTWTIQVDTVAEWAYADNVFSKEQCAKIIEDNQDFVDAVVDEDKDPNLNIRQSSVCWISPSEKNKWIFQRLVDAIGNINSRYFNFDLFGMIEGIQLTKYDAPSGFYVPHIDKMANSNVRKLSISVQLTNPEDYEGGELVLHTSATPMPMKKDIGTLIAFPSYVLHEVKPVTKGTRYSLVVWVTGNQFK